MWQVPNSTYAGYFNVGKIKQALNNPPTRYRILIGQNGISRSPPVFSSNIEQINPLGIHLLLETDRHITQIYNIPILKLLTMAPITNQINITKVESLATEF